MRYRPHWDNDARSKHQLDTPPELQGYFIDCVEILCGQLRTTADCCYGYTARARSTDLAGRRCSWHRTCHTFGVSTFLQTVSAAFGSLSSLLAQQDDRTDTVCSSVLVERRSQLHWCSFALLPSTMSLHTQVGDGTQLRLSCCTSKLSTSAAGSSQLVTIASVLALQRYTTQECVTASSGTSFL